MGLGDEAESYVEVLDPSFFIPWREKVSNDDEYASPDFKRFESERFLTDYTDNVILHGTAHTDAGIVAATDRFAKEMEGHLAALTGFIGHWGLRDAQAEELRQHARCPEVDTCYAQWDFADRHPQTLQNPMCLLSVSAPVVRNGPL